MRAGLSQDGSSLLHNEKSLSDWNLLECCSLTCLVPGLREPKGRAEWGLLPRALPHGLLVTCTCSEHGGLSYNRTFYMAVRTSRVNVSETMWPLVLVSAVTQPPFCHILLVEAVTLLPAPGGRCRECTSAPEQRQRALDKLRRARRGGNGIWEKG